MESFHPELFWNRLIEDPCCKAQRTWCRSTMDDSAHLCHAKSGGVVSLGDGRRLHLSTGTTGTPNQLRRLLVQVFDLSRGLATPAALKEFADGVHVSVEALARLDPSPCLSAEALVPDPTAEASSFGTPPTAWAFPLVNWQGAILGYDEFLPNGQPFKSYPGNQGLYIPSPSPEDGTPPLPTGEYHDHGQDRSRSRLANIWQRWSGTPCLAICEGPFDTAVMLDLGVTAVGRSTLTSGWDLLAKFAKAQKPKEVLVITGDDDRRRQAAEALVAIMGLFASTRLLVLPPDVSDLRALRDSGVDLHAAIAAAPSYPRVRLA